jgi:hypothetical protein
MSVMSYVNMKRTLLKSGMFGAFEQSYIMTGFHVGGWAIVAAPMHITACGTVA